MVLPRKKYVLYLFFLMILGYFTLNYLGKYAYSKKFLDIGYKSDVNIPDHLDIKLNNVTKNRRNCELTGNNQTIREPIDVQWKMYMNSTFSDSDHNYFYNGSKHGPLSPSRCKRHYFKLASNLPSKLQLKMLSGFLLTCYPQKEGIFPKVYRKFLSVLSKYADDNQSMSSSHRTLVWQCPADEGCGGLADRFKGMVFAFLLAIFSNRRFVLDWHSPENIYFKPNVINWMDENLQKILRSPNDIDCLPDGHVVKFHLYEDSKYPFFVDSEDTVKTYFDLLAGNENIVVMVTNMDIALISQYLRKTKNWISKGFEKAGLLNLVDHDLDDILGLVLRYLFQMNVELSNHLLKARKVLKLTGQPYVGVHLRSGFAGVKHAIEFAHEKLISDKKKWDLILQCAVTTANKFLGNNSLIFLATDSDIIKEMAVSKYGMRFRTLSNYLVHVGTMDRKKKPIKEEEEGILFMLVDLLLLAESYVHVRGYSGYGWVSGLLCGPLPNEHLIDSVTCKTDDLNIIHI